MVEQKELGIKVTGDIEDITNALGSVVDLLTNIVDKTVEVVVSVNDTQLQELDTQLETLDNQTLDESVQVEDSQLDEVETTIEQLDGQTINEIVDVDATELDTVESDLEQLDGQTLHETVEVDSQGIDEATNSLQELGNTGEQASNQVTTSMDGAISKVDELGNKSSEAAQKTGEIGDKAQETGSKAESGMDQAILAVAALTVGLELAAEQAQDLNIYFDKVSGTIPEEEMRDFFATLSNAKFPVDEVRTYITLLKQMGLTSQDELGKSAQAFNDIRIATGSSVETMKKFGSSVAVMGIDLANIPSAFNAIAYAQANVIGGFEAYVQWMQKYDATFRELGLNIDQTAVIIAAATKKWGGGRAAYQGLNEAIRESNGNLDILEQKLGLQPGALAHASEETAKYSGKIEKNSDIVRDHTTALQQSGDVVSDLQVRYGDLIETLGGLGAVIASIAGIFGLVIPKILGMWDDLWKTTYKESYTKGLSGIVDKVRSFGDDVGKTIKGWIGWGDDAGRAAGRIGTAIEGQVDNPTIWGKIRNFGSRVSNIINKDWAIWGDEAGKVTVDMVKGVDGTWTAKSPGIIDKIINFGRRIPTALDDAIKLVGWKLPSLDGAGVGILDGLGGGILKAIPKLVSKLAIPLTIAQLIAEELYNYTDRLDESVGETYFDMLTSGFGQSIYEALVPEFLRNFIDPLNDFLSPSHLGPLIFGEGYTQMTDWISTNIEKPFRDWVDSIIPTLQGIISGTTKIDILGMIFGGIGDPGAGLNSIIEGIKSSIVGFASWLTGVPMTWVPWDWNNVVGNLGLVWTNITTQFTNFTTWLSTIPGQIISFFSTLPENLGRLVGDAIVFILQSIYNILSFIINLPGQIVAALGNLGAQIQGVVANILPAIQGAWAQVTKIFTDFYNFIVALPGNVVIALTNLGTQIYNTLVAMVEKVKVGLNVVIQQFQNFINWMVNLPGTIVSYVTKMGNDMIAVIQSIPERVRVALNVIIQKFNDFINWLKGLPDEIRKWIEKTFNDMVNVIASIPDRVKRELDKVINKFWDFIHWIEGLPNQLYRAILNAWDGFMRGLSEKFPQIEYWLGKIRDLFPHSPPKIGPLVDIMDWGKNMADAIGSGFDRAFPGIAGRFADKLQVLKDMGMDLQTGYNFDVGIPENRLKVINQTMSNLNEPNTTNDNSFSLTLQVDTVNAATKEKARESLENVEEVIKEILEQQLAQKGIPIYNIR